MLLPRKFLATMIVVPAIVGVLGASAAAAQPTHPASATMSSASSQIGDYEDMWDGFLQIDKSQQTWTTTYDQWALGRHLFTFDSTPTSTAEQEVALAQLRYWVGQMKALGYRFTGEPGLELPGEAVALKAIHYQGKWVKPCHNDPTMQFFGTIEIDVDPGHTPESGQFHVSFEGHGHPEPRPASD